MPAEVDFDALWERVYQPVLEELGYQAVRADRDVGALIISQMIQRLAIADLVVADITLANANVYYEVGVRHAAKEKGCVLVGADWARPVFDLEQMRQLRFPLADGDVGERPRRRRARRCDATSRRWSRAPRRCSTPCPASRSPSWTASTAFADAMAELSEFEADIRAVRAAPETQRADRVRALLRAYGERPAVRDLVWLELLPLVRDNLGFAGAARLHRRLPANVAQHPLVLEQHALALSKTGDARRRSASSSS